MRIVIFGSSGMVGQGALRECLGDREVGQVLSVVRAPSGNAHEKLHEIEHNNFLDFTPIENQLVAWASRPPEPAKRATHASRTNLPSPRQQRS